MDALKAEHLVKRTAHPTDRRVTMVEITGGAAIVEQGFAAFESAVGNLFDGLDDAEAEALQRALTVLRDERLNRALGSRQTRTNDPHELRACRRPDLGPCIGPVVLRRRVRQAEAVGRAAS